MIRRRHLYSVSDAHKQCAYAWRRNNPSKVKESAKVGRIKNKNRINYSNNMRYAQKLRATPLWADVKAIREIYLNRPEGFHVDHIVPLRGTIVCGLHVEYNLQYLSASENQSKNNKLLDIKNASGN